MIVLIEMNDNLTVKPYHLNTQSVANKLVGVMFGWRKKDSSDLQNICPYCSTPNEIGSKECKLCYYDLTVSARDQPMAKPSSTESDIMTTLLGDDAVEEEEEDYAVEAVLSLDEVTIDIDQFEANNPDAEGQFEFIASTGPTLSEVQDYSKPDEVELSPDDAPKQESDFIVPEANPLDEVAEPVHTGQGSLFLDSVDSDEDFSDTVGPNQSRNMEPQVISEEAEDSNISLTSAISQEDTNETPELPTILDEPSDLEVESTPEIPEIPESVSVETQEETPAIPDIPDDTSKETQDDTPDIPDVPLDAEAAVAQDDTPNDIVPAPTPQFNGRIWPWPAKEAWDERQVYREVVSMLELIKTGKLTQTAQQLDNLGPHLDGNLDMLAHIGTIMRYLGREEHLQWMLKMAQTTYPSDPNVARAITHLS
tara:strand:- start:840 stop:2108 length:1269 start_codon:yes stop_codon:yes gene_type:complete